MDGEATPEEGRAVDRHVANCVSCRAFASTAAALHRGARVRTAEAVPDLSAAVLARIPVAPRRRTTPEWPRYALLVVALTQLVLALPALVLGNDSGASIHVARELGSWDVALAVGLLVAAWQPRRAAGLLPMAVALAGAMIVTAVLDVVSGRAPALGEAHHALDLAGVICLWALAHPATTRPRLSRPRLRTT
jgi:predicted anti-sigma-YlaC factor YlaD